LSPQTRVSCISFHRSVLGVDAAVGRIDVSMFRTTFLVRVMTDGIASIVAALPLGASAVFEATGG
jgi:hypothetical protein